MKEAFEVIQPLEKIGELVVENTIKIIKEKQEKLKCYYLLK